MLQAASVACGGDFTVVLTRDGQLFNCGHPEHGQVSANLLLLVTPHSYDKHCVLSSALVKFE
jgi:alpha-tubulin suppressor-like RCC1 family protein